MGFGDGTGWDGFSEGQWNCKAIPIMNELVQMESMALSNALEPGIGNAQERGAEGHARVDMMHLGRYCVILKNDQSITTAAIVHNAKYPCLHIQNRH